MKLPVGIQPGVRICLRERVSNGMLGLKGWPWEGENALLLTESWFRHRFQKVATCRWKGTECYSQKALRGAKLL